MRSKDELGLLMNSVFQVAEITRPLMSVSPTCDQDMLCIFEKDHTRVLDTDGNSGPIRARWSFAHLYYEAQTT